MTVQCAITVIGALGGHWEQAERVERGVIIAVVAIVGQTPLGLLGKWKGGDSLR